MEWLEFFVAWSLFGRANPKLRTQIDLNTSIVARFLMLLLLLLVVLLLVVVVAVSFKN